MATKIDLDNQKENKRKGRSSQEEVKNRYDICCKLLKKTKKFKNYNNFLTHYKKALKEANINEPSSSILQSDVNAACQLLREDGIFINPLMKGKSTAFQEFGEKHKGEIYRVYLSVNGCEYRLFSKRGKHDYLKNYSNYKDLLGIIFENLPPTASQSFDFENPYSFIGHLYIVLHHFTTYTNSYIDAETAVSRHQ